LDPTYSGAHVLLAGIYLKRNDLHQARRHLRSEILLHPEEPRVLLELANLLLDTADPRAAVACLKRLVQLQPDNTAAWQNLAVAPFAREHFEEGIEACHQALQIDPNNLPTLFNLA